MSNLNVQKNILLENHTTFKIGGEAKFFIEVKSLDKLKFAINWAKNKKLPIFILGKGSNLLVSDNGFAGLVIKIKNEKLKFKNNLVYAEAGVDLNFLIKKCLGNNLIGLENLISIPGTVGGAVRGNAGAWLSQISDFVEKVKVFDLEKLELKNFTKKACKFNYRESIFKKNPNLIIWSVVLNLKKGTTRELSAAQEVIKNISQKRKISQPNYPSAGCVFKNLKQEKFQEFLKDNPHLEISERFIKNKAMPVAWLIDNLDLKGFKVGGAQVSEKHANFIINKNNATAEDVITLISIIKTKVRNKFKVQLQEEIEYLGF